MTPKSWREQLLNQTRYWEFFCSIADGSWWEPNEFSRVVAASKPLQSLVLDAARIAQAAALLEVVRASGASAMAGRTSGESIGAEQVEQLIGDAASAARTSSAEAARFLWQACSAATLGVSSFDREPGSAWPLPLGTMAGPLLEGAAAIGAQIALSPIILGVESAGPLQQLAQARQVNEWVLSRGDAVFDPSVEPSAEVVIRLLELRAAFGWYLAFRAIVEIAIVRESLTCRRPSLISEDTSRSRN